MCVNIFSVCCKVCASYERLLVVRTMLRHALHSGTSGASWNNPHHTCLHYTCDFVFNEVKLSISSCVVC